MIIIILTFEIYIFMINVRRSLIGASGSIDFYYPIILDMY